MGDADWLCMFKADVTDRNNIRGNLRVKIRISQVEEIVSDRKEMKRLNITFGQENEKITVGLHFDN
jgi:hypothetical protein